MITAMFLTILLCVVGYISPSNVSAATSYTSVEKLVSEAEENAEALKSYYNLSSSKQITISSSFMSVYDESKASINEAQTAIYNLSDSRKSDLQKD